MKIIDIFVEPYQYNPAYKIIVHHGIGRRSTWKLVFIRVKSKFLCQLRMNGEEFDWKFHSLAQKA